LRKTKSGQEISSETSEILHSNKDQNKICEKGSQMSRLLKDIKHAVYCRNTEDTASVLINEEGSLLSAALHQQLIEDLTHESCDIERWKKLLGIDFQHREADQRGSILEVQKSGSEVERNSWGNEGQRLLELSEKLMTDLRDCEEIKHIFFDLIRKNPLQVFSEAPLTALQRTRKY
jgi:hypothetical protein